jgi:hypothetical protein
MIVSVSAFSVVRVQRKKPRGQYSFVSDNDEKKISGPYILLDYLAPYQFIAQTERKLFWQRAKNGQDMIPTLVMNKQTTQWQRNCSNNSAATAWFICICMSLGVGGTVKCHEMSKY